MTRHEQIKNLISEEENLIDLIYTTDDFTEIFGIEESYCRNRCAGETLFNPEEDCKACIKDWLREESE